MFLKTIVIFLLLNLMVACSSKKSNDSSSGVVEPVQLIDLSLDGNAPAVTVLQEVDYSFDPIVDNVENIHFTVQNMPSWVNFDPNTGRLWGKPSRDDVGVYPGIVITAYDNKGNAQSFPPFELAVEFVNTAPVISGTPSSTINQKSAYHFETQASDVDNDDLTYSLTNHPDWLSINATTGVVSGTPTQANVGKTEGIVITVADVAGATASLPAFTLTVINVNDAPTIEGSPATLVLQEGTYNFAPRAQDIDGDALSYSIENNPSWLVINETTGVVSGTPNSQSDVGKSEGIVITVTDINGANASLQAFDLVVINVNDAPTITGNPATSVLQNEGYSFTPIAEDIDGDALTYSMINNPSWLSINNTGVVSGTPTQDDVGTSEGIVVTVADANGAIASLPAFDLVVINVNDVPTITGNPATSVLQNEGYSFTPIAEDIDGDALTYSMINNPSWLSINNTGVVSGTPTQDDVGTSEGIVISVADASGEKTSLPAFDLTVINVNDAPTIEGTPVTSILENKHYNFSPTATDIDGDTLIYTITNSPNWLSIDETTGAVSGDPATMDVGITSGVVITVTDEEGLSARLAPFDIEVIEVPKAELTGKINGVGFGENDKEFSFTKLGANGELLDDGASTWSCIKDNTTGMIWEVKTESGLHNKEDRYVWQGDAFGFDKPSSGVMYADDNVCFGGVQCNTQAFVQRVNTASLCGASDWRVPSREELRSLSKLNDMTAKDNIAHIDSNYFPQTMPSHKVDCMDFYDRDAANVLVLKEGVSDLPDFTNHCATFGADSSGDRSYQNRYRGRGIGYATVDTDYTLDVRNSWVIFYDDIEMDHSLIKDELRYVRLVRGDALVKDYTLSADGEIVSDNNSGLDWKRCVEGYHLDSGSCIITTAETTEFTYAESLNIVNNNVEGWRLPTIKELTSLGRFDAVSSSPAISSVFPNTPAVKHWTSTRHQQYPLVEGREYYWQASFLNAGDRVKKSIFTAHVRLVRDTPASGGAN